MSFSLNVRIVLPWLNRVTYFLFFFCVRSSVLFLAWTVFFSAADYKRYWSAANCWLFVMKLLWLSMFLWIRKCCIIFSSFFVECFSCDVENRFFSSMYCFFLQWITPGTKVLRKCDEVLWWLFFILLNKHAVSYFFKCSHFERKISLKWQQIQNSIALFYMGQSHILPLAISTTVNRVYKKVINK